jgi:acyl-CoA thioesterase FadM
VTAAGDGRTLVTLRPRYDAANIRTWIGFKQFMLLAEEAVLQWFRDRGAGPGRLYHEHGLGLEVVDSSVQLPALLDVDDEVTAEVVREASGRFAVTLTVRREEAAVRVLRGRVAVALVREPRTPARRAVPGEVASLVVDDVAAAAPADEPAGLRLRPGEDVRSALGRLDAAAFLWSWRAPYFACHFSDRVQHSGYVRALEDVVDRFLAARGLSVRRMLAERGWVPVVSRARVRLVAAAHMEEVVHTSFAVDEVLKRAAYRARMECFVQRGDRLMRCATASILHGYAQSRGEHAGRVVELDDGALAALAGRVEA